MYPRTSLAIAMMLFTALQVCQIRCRDRLHDAGMLLKGICYCADRLQANEMVPIDVYTLHTQKEAREQADDRSYRSYDN